MLPALWLLALVGLALCIELTVIYYRSFSDQGYRPICPMESVFDCKGAALSPYSRFLGLPNSLYGMAVYLLVLVLIPMRVWTRVRLFKNLELYLLLLALVSVAMTVWLAYVSFFLLNKLCSWCTALYLVDIGFLILVLLALEGPAQVREQIAEDLKMFQTEPKALGVGVLTAVILIASLIVLYERSKRVWVPPGPELPSGVVIDISNDPVIGPSRAPVTIIEFSDFQCPYCRDTAQAIQTLQKKHHREVRLIFKNFPLDDKCNPMVKGSPHPNSCVAAISAECAYKMGGFEQMYNKLMSADNYSPESLMGMAKELGLNLNEFGLCLRSGPANQEVMNDIQEAIKLNIEGTPLLIINSHKYTSALTEPQLEVIVTRILEGKEPPGFE